MGNIYSSTNAENLGRISGSKTTFISNNNYAYDNQFINGKNEDVMDADKLINIEDLLNKQIYEDLGWTSFDFSNVNEDVLPKLYYSDKKELLPNQQEIKIEAKNLINIEDIQYEKTTSNKVTVRLTINNPNNEEIQNVQIDNMEIEINKNIYQAGQTYIELTATPIKYYDSYMVSKIILKDEEVETQRKIDVSFYKELYTYEDWQNIDKDSSENYMLMADIDFSGKTDVNHNVNIGRLISNTETKSIKNIELTDNLIDNISLELKNISFENIKINSNKFGGLISLQEGNLDNVVFKDIIIESKDEYVGCIATSKATDINNVTLKNINVQGGNFTAGFIGRQYGTSSMSNFSLNEIDIKSTGNYVAGLIGYTETGGSIANINGADINVSSNKNYVGGLFGYNSKTISNINVENSYVSGNSCMLEVFLDTCGNSLSFNGQNIIDGVNVEGKGGK